jgi:protein TonB
MGIIRKLSPSFISSLLFHAALFLFWAYTAAHTHRAHPARSRPILVELEPLPQVRARDTTKNQVVQTEKTTRTKDAAPNAFLGEQTQRVDHQTVSTPKTGTAPKRAQSKPVVAEKTERPAAPKTPLITATGALAKYGIEISAGKENSPKPPAAVNPIEEGSLTAQARGEYVKGFKAGEQTMLNTREFVFYGYFQRIRQRLDRAWEKSLRERLAKYFYRGRQLASETDYMTQLLVSLDKEGRITKVQIIGNSGTTELDEAATKAFNDAGPFPNPPSGLVDPKGQVFVRWDFVLKT